MKIAIPTANGQLCLHFGHCQQFLVVDIDGNEIKSKTFVTPPPHAPGVIPEFLSKQDINCVITGGMGMRAQNMFEQQNIKVITGIQTDNTDEIIQAYINGSLQSGENICDH